MVAVLVAISCSKENVQIKPNIGSRYEGGVCFYIFQPSDPGYKSGEAHGFIVAEKDLSGEYIWGCQNAPYNEFGWQLGEGYSNTALISKWCPNGNMSVILGMKIEGYTDWWIPNSPEMKLMYNNKQVIPNLGNGWYWTSSKATYTEAYAGRFSDGNYDFFNINTLYSVRPIRKF